MISRIWHGWTTDENAGTYETLLRTEILPGIENREIEGYLGAHLLRKSRSDEVEFITICWFEHWEAVKEFAGEDYESSVVPSRARALLTRYDERAEHYETVLSPNRIV